MKSLGAVPGFQHTIRRNNALLDIVDLYKEGTIMIECPISIHFDNEIAVDDGGLSREMFSLFWEEDIHKHFEGAQTVTPLVHAHTDMKLLHLIGRVLSHGYLVSGFLPVCISLPCLIFMLLGNMDAEISDEVLLEAFLDYVSIYHHP